MRTTAIFFSLGRDLRTEQVEADLAPNPVSAEKHSAPELTIASPSDKLESGTLVRLRKQEK